MRVAAPWHTGIVQPSAIRRAGRVTGRFGLAAAGSGCHVLELVEDGGAHEVEDGGAHEGTGVVRCERCGLVIGAAAVGHDHSIAFAASCRRCGARVDGRSSERSGPDPSVYLG
jgi:hypothetical protein